MFQAEYRKKCQLLALFCVIVIIIIYLQGLRLGLADSATGRVRYHAIPVAISVIYHNHPHNYTAIRELAIPFQGSGPLQQMISEAVTKKISYGDILYWPGDDKGFADFVIVAFRLFGPNLKSMYYLWFVCLTFSVVLFLISFRRSLTSLAFLSMTLIGVYVAISVVRISSPEVSIYEPRFLDVLAMIPVIHICLFALKRTWWPGSFQVAGLVGQVAFFFWLFHARSSLGWQIVAIVNVSLCVVILRLSRRKQFRISKAKNILTPTLIIILMAIGPITLSQYKKISYHPRYYEDMGFRVVWHNAVMGLCDDPFIRTTYGVTRNDFDVACAVTKFACGGECSDSAVKMDAQALLNSFGGHGERDWYAYEDSARKFYIFIWKSHPFNMLRMYTLTKPKMVYDWLYFAFWTSPKSFSSDVRDQLIDQQLFSLSILAVAVIVLLVSSTSLYRNRRSVLALLIILLASSLIPSISFYGDIWNLGGFIVVIIVLFCLLFMLVGRWLINWLHAEKVICK